MKIKRICKICGEYKEYCAKGLCRECYGEKRYIKNREYVREYNLKHKIEHRKSQKKYYLKQEKYYENYRKTHCQDRKKCVRKWRKENPERIKITNKKWVKNNPDKIREYNFKRKINGTIEKGVVDRVINANILKYGSIICEKCEKECLDNYHIDHIIPISKGGNNDYSNLQILCAHCNLVKHVDIADYRQNIGDNQLYLRI